MKPTLLILAAGMGSRYGGIKQMDEFGPNGETIIDYSIYDAIEAGFGKIVFIIREDFAEEFKKIFDPKLKGKVAVEYVYQHLEDFVDNPDTISSERSKPWGTAHAVLCGKDVVSEPFAVINADDFYGREAFDKMAAFLKNECAKDRYSVMGYKLSNTLSDNGSVSRGVCEATADGNLKTITERTKIEKENGEIAFDENGQRKVLPGDTLVSMNFWGFDPSVFEYTEKMFKKFVEENKGNPKAEFFIPIVIDKFIASGAGTVKVIPVDTKWFGVTYKEDAPSVKNNLQELIGNGAYPQQLWA